MQKLKESLVSSLSSVIAVILGFYILSSFVNDEVNAYRGIITIHQKSCIDNSKSVFDCPKDKIIYVTLRFRSDFDKQIVVGQGISAFPTDYLPNCKVLNSYNWYCHNDDFSRTYNLKNGSYFEGNEGDKSALVNTIQIGNFEYWTR